MPPPPDLTAFCRNEYPRLVGLLGLYCGDRALGEDLAQEALARVCRDWSRVRRRDQPSAWASRVAINLANSYFRRKKAEKRATLRLAGQPVRGAKPEPADVVMLRTAIGTLPRRERTAIVLRFYLDLPFAAIADVMGMPLSTVKTLTSRGVEHLRKETGSSDHKEIRHVHTTP